ncbi:MAG: hypothetical protein QM571_05655 [Micrococcaceae bacterium]
MSTKFLKIIVDIQDEITEELEFVKNSNKMPDFELDALMPLAADIERENAKRKTHGLLRSTPPEILAHHKDLDKFRKTIQKLKKDHELTLDEQYLMTKHSLFTKMSFLLMIESISLQNRFDYEYWENSFQDNIENVESILEAKEVFQKEIADFEREIQNHKK